MSVELATLAGGCFWCLEPAFEELCGVSRVVAGYSGGRGEPTYEEVCRGQTGHAEVVQITFDPAQLSFRDLLAIFFSLHDPTTLNRQGADVGTQYRSAIFAHSPAQREIAQQVIRELSEARLFDRPIVTEVVDFERFDPAEDYHQGYFAAHPEQPYCVAVVAPKVAKFRKQHFDRLRREGEPD